MRDHHKYLITVQAPLQQQDPALIVGKTSKHIWGSGKPRKGYCRSHSSSELELQKWISRSTCEHFGGKHFGMLGCCWLRSSSAIGKEVIHQGSGIP